MLYSCIQGESMLQHIQRAFNATMPPPASRILEHISRHTGLNSTTMTAHCPATLTLLSPAMTACQLVASLSNYIQTATIDSSRIEVKTHHATSHGACSSTVACTQQNTDSCQTRGCLQQAVTSSNSNRHHIPGTLPLLVTAMAKTHTSSEAPIMVSFGPACLFDDKTHNTQVTVQAYTYRTAAATIQQLSPARAASD